MKQMAGSKTTITPEHFHKKFYNNKFEIYGLKCEQNLGYMVVSFEFKSMSRNQVEDNMLTSIGFHSADNKKKTAPANIWIYESDIISIQEVYHAVQDEQQIHHSYKYTIELQNGKNIKLQSVQRIEI